MIYLYISILFFILVVLIGGTYNKIQENHKETIKYLERDNETKIKEIVDRTISNFN